MRLSGVVVRFKLEQTGAHQQDELPTRFEARLPALRVSDMLEMCVGV